MGAAGPGVLSRCWCSNILRPRAACAPRARFWSWLGACGFGSGELGRWGRVPRRAVGPLWASDVPRPPRRRAAPAAAAWLCGGGSRFGTPLGCVLGRAPRGWGARCSARPRRALRRRVTVPCPSPPAVTPSCGRRGAACHCHTPCHAFGSALPLLRFRRAVVAGRMGGGCGVRGHATALGWDGRAVRRAEPVEQLLAGPVHWVMLCCTPSPGPRWWAGCVAAVCHVSHAFFSRRHASLTPVNHRVHLLRSSLRTVTPTYLPTSAAASPTYLPGLGYTGGGWA